jgi:hypothetical protein
MWTLHSSAAVLLAAALAACGCKTDPRPASGPTAASAADAGTPRADTGDTMNGDMMIPAEAYRLAAGADGRWAWAPSNSAAILTNENGHRAVPGSAPVNSLFFASDGATLYAGLARLDLNDGSIAIPVGRAQYGAGFTGKAELNLVKGYHVVGGAWSRAGDLVICSLEYRLPKRESVPPKNGPTQRLLAFDPHGTLVADMGDDAHPLIAISKERVFATGGLVISTWKRSDLTKPEKKIKAKAGISQMVLSPDESRLAYTWNGGVGGHPSATGNVVVHDIASGADVAAWQADTRVADVSWHPSGEMVATAGEHGAKVWKVDGSEVKHARTEPATAVAFTPDGKELLVALAGLNAKVVRVELP